MEPIDSTDPAAPKITPIEGNITQRSRWHGKEDRLNFEAATTANIDTVATRIGSIRVKLNPKEISSGKWDHSKWVLLHIKGDGGAEQDVLANIKSISKRTGLTKSEIQSAVKRHTLESLLTDTVKKSVVGLVEGLKTELGTTYSNSVLCTSEGHYDSVDLCEQFHLTETQYKNLVKNQQFKFGEITSHKNEIGRTYHTRLVTLVLEKPLDADLKKIVKNVHKLRKKAIGNPSKKSNQFSNQKDAISDRWSFKKSISVGAYVSPEGEIYLSTLSRKLGHGSYKEVFFGTEISTSRQIVFGVPKQLDSDEVDNEMLLRREMSILKDVADPNLPKDFHTCFQIKTGIFKRKRGIGIIIQYYNGGTLEAFNKSALPELEKVKSELLIMEQLAKRLCYIHKMRVAHADIKPENVFLKKNSQGVVTHANFADYGLSKYDSEFQSQRFSGTPDFMSPRQIVKLETAYSNDIWALAMTFLEMLDPSNIPLFSQEIFDKIRSPGTLVRANGIQEYRKALNMESGPNGIHFEKQRPQVYKPELEDRVDDPSVAKKTKNELIQLCWDMLFFGWSEEDMAGNMTAKDVVTRIEEIKKNFNDYLISISSPEKSSKSKFPLYKTELL